MCVEVSMRTSIEIDNALLNKAFSLSKAKVYIPISYSGHALFGASQVNL